MQNKMNFQLTLGLSDPIQNKEEVARNIANGILNQVMDFGITAEDDEGFANDIIIGSEDGVPLIHAEISPHDLNLIPISNLTENEVAGYIQREAIRRVSRGLSTISRQMESDDRFREWIEATPFFSFFTGCIDEVSREILHIVSESESVEEKPVPANRIKIDNVPVEGLISEQTKKDTRPVLVSQTGLVHEPKYQVFFSPVRQLESEFAKFLKMETGLDLTISLAGDEFGNLSLNIKEENNSITIAGEEMTVAEFLDNKHNYTLYCNDESQTARDVAAHFFDIHVNDLAHLQYLEDDDNSDKSEVRFSIASFALQPNDNEETIGGSYIARRAVSNMLYFLLKAAQAEIKLSLLYPECTHFEDVIYGTILEWSSDVEKQSSSCDPAFDAFEVLLKEELVEGTYLDEGAQSFLQKVAAALDPGNVDPQKLVFYQIIERLALKAERIRSEREEN
ncbi:hypothetical protein EHV15_34135 [Paenibacillus oralis]|uniref:Uncharacterized protein n=1 Tax=Paenibacillus oralis TaxID=2490856 RepID=A0A3P3TBZ7_9BACL|nr:hypothetical protein [Paenibacillus oralis]RRJ54638.1 hypothetical protein EHV15_34135 [Paenibacillus oralis]